MFIDALNAETPRAAAVYGYIKASKIARYLWCLFIYNQPALTWFTIVEKKVHYMAKFTPATFATLRLTKDDEKDFTDWASKLKVSPVDLLVDLTGRGFKVSAAWIDDQNSFVVSLIGTDRTKLHQGMVLTSWSNDLGEAIVITAYKHLVVCNEQAWPVEQSGDRWG